MAIWNRIRRLKSVDADALAEEKFGQEEAPFEKNDKWAMILSAMISLWLPCVLVLLALGGLLLLLFT